MQIVTTISTALDTMSRLLIKVLRFGGADVQTNFNVAPYGDDSNPIAGMKAIYSTTSQNGRTVIVGYINTKSLAQAGEKRLYATDRSGNVMSYIWLHSDGTCELLGNTDNLVNYTALASACTTFQNAIQAELVKIATGITSAGGSYTPSVLNFNISGSKNLNLKTS